MTSPNGPFAGIDHQGILEHLDAREALLNSVVDHLSQGQPPEARAETAEAVFELASTEEGMIKLQALLQQAGLLG